MNPQVKAKIEKQIIQYLESIGYYIMKDRRVSVAFENLLDYLIFEKNFNMEDYKTYRDMLYSNEESNRLIVYNVLTNIFKDLKDENN